MMSQHFKKRENFVDYDDYLDECQMRRVRDKTKNATLSFTCALMHMLIILGLSI